MEGVCTYLESDFSYTCTAVAAWGWDGEWVLITQGDGYVEGRHTHIGKESANIMARLFTKEIIKMKQISINSSVCTVYKQKVEKPSRTSHMSCNFTSFSTDTRDLLPVQMLYLAWSHILLTWDQLCDLLLPIIICIDLCITISEATMCIYNTYRTWQVFWGGN